MRSHICRKFLICRPISFTIISFYDDEPTRFLPAYLVERSKNFAAVLKRASEEVEMRRWDEERARRRDRYLRARKHERSAAINVGAASTLEAR